MPRRVATARGSILVVRYLFRPGCEVGQIVVTAKRLIKQVTRMIWQPRVIGQSRCAVVYTPSATTLRPRRLAT